MHYITIFTTKIDLKIDKGLESQYFVALDPPTINKIISEISLQFYIDYNKYF